MNHTLRPVTIIPGDGIGPEVMMATLRVLEALDAPFTWDVHALSVDGSSLNPDAIASIRRTGLGLKGPTGTPTGGKQRSFNVGLRLALDLYANVRPVRSIVPNPKFGDVDLIIFRENTEGGYVGEEREIPGGMESISRFTTKASRRIARVAFEWALNHGRTKMTIVHKGNIVKAHEVFINACRAIAADYPEIESEDRIADNMMMQLVMNHLWYDSLLTTNDHGDLFSDLCAGLIGGLGFAPGANIGDDVAVFEAVHGTAPDIAGKGIANPAALMLSAAMMLDYCGMSSLAERLRHAIIRTVADGIVTGDVKGYTTHTNTAGFTDAVIARL